jgi:small subunit ribosomal protein S8
MDTIGDLLTQIRNALRVRKEFIDVPYSKMKEGIAKILLLEGYLGKVDVLSRGNKKYLRIGLKYVGKKSVIENLKRVSKPGRRIYVDAQSLPRVQAGFGTAIISTSKGLLTDEQARQQRLGGEVICYVW